LSIKPQREGKNLKIMAEDGIPKKISDAITKLAGPKSTGKCAAVVREAI
jgi:hypothetical protein